MKEGQQIDEQGVLMRIGQRSEVETIQDYRSEGRL